MNRSLFSYIRSCPTPYHAVEHTARRLSEAGFEPLCEGEKWELTAGHGYYVVRGGASIVAFRLPKTDFVGFMMTASHCDSPCFKIKENAELRGENYVRLSTEPYGGMLYASWVDRPLSIAGRVTVRTDDGFAVKTVDLEDAVAVIPNVAIHLNRKANEKTAYDPAVDPLPLYGDAADAETLRSRIAQKLQIEEQAILSTDLFLYNPEAGVEWNGLISAPRLDDLQCAFAALTAFLQAKESESVPVYCLFDNEEVGSQTKQGAASTFLFDVLLRISLACNKGEEGYRRAIAHSFLASCDNGHAVHPAHPEYADKNHAVRLNGGVVVKYNANQRYTSDALSTAAFRLACEAADVPLQAYCNRADMAGGSTLGNIANTQVSLNTVDIGLAQLAMHSAFETAGAKDTEAMVRALTELYGKTLYAKADGSYQLK